VRSRRHSTAVVVAALLGTPATLAASAYAQAPSEPTRAAEREEAARAAHRKGLAAFDAGDLDGAIEAFRRAYELSPTPGLLFNLAQTYRAKGPAGCTDALRFYEAYVRQYPDAPNRDVADEHLGEMRRCVDAQRPPTKTAPATSSTLAPPSAPPSAVAPRSGAVPWAPILLGFAGAAAGAVGVGLYVSASQDFDRLQQSCPRQDCDPASWAPDRTRERIAIALFGVGAALVVSGVVVWVLAPSQRTSKVAALWSASPGAASGVRF
jgi:tetratricopeptide (TPR) repeat protein